MDIDTNETTRERATSSEPCSSRLNPFEAEESASRKRQRVSPKVSRSLSVDTGNVLALFQARGTPSGTTAFEDATTHLSTARRPPSPRSTESPSSKVTINLRSKCDDDSKSPTLRNLGGSLSMKILVADERGTHRQEDFARAECEPVIISSSPSSGSSSPASPPVEILLLESDNEDSQCGRSRQLFSTTLSNGQAELDPMTSFPFRSGDETLLTGLKKIVRFFESDNVADADSFRTLGNWMSRFLHYHGDGTASSVENYLEYKDFWDSFPEIIWALSRRRHFGPFLTRSTKGRKAVSRLFVNFAHLCAYFVRLDLHMLVQMTKTAEVSTETVTASKNYLAAFAWLYRKDESLHIGRSLDAHYQWNWSNVLAGLIDSFLASCGHITALTSLAQALLSPTVQYSRAIENLTDVSRLIHYAVVEAAAALDQTKDSAQHPNNQACTILRASYRYFQVLEPMLRQIVDSHSPCLNVDVAAAHLSSLTQILHCCTYCEPCPVHDMLENCRQNCPELPLDSYGTAISKGWKFLMLRKLIKSGQMHLRVFGVMTMCQDLLLVFSMHKREERYGFALGEHFANIVLECDIVGYIVSPASHPELVLESANIIGFLVATKTYSTLQTNTLWNAIRESEDPRMVEAILRMLSQILNLFAYQDLLDFCVRAAELPLSAFNVPIRDFCDRLFDCVLQRSNSEQTSRIASPPYDLCIRIIRQSSIGIMESLPSSLEWQRFAVSKLHELMLYGPDIEVRKDLYINCIDDIAHRTPTSPGSVCALLALLRQDMVADIHTLTHSHDLTRLIVDDLDFTMSSDASAGDSDVERKPFRQARRDLLRAIIVYEPASIVPQLGERLWHLLVGHLASSTADRQIAWQMLNSAAKKARSINVFLTVCLNEYIAMLEPRFFTFGTLEFLKEGILVWMHHQNVDLLTVLQSQDVSMIEQIWQIVLTCPPELETSAIGTLAEIYLVGTHVDRMPADRLQQSHSLLITRCLDQLATAASALQDRHTQVPDEHQNSAAHTLISAEQEKQRLLFKRSLILLREFLKAYQSKTQAFAPTPKKPVLLTPATQHGEPVNVKYQSFDGRTISGQMTLHTGKSNSIAAVLGGIKSATGFQAFKVYHFGKELDYYDLDLATSVEALKLHSGLLLIVECDEARLLNRGHPSHVEIQTRNHFSQLWSYLAMEESLSREVISETVLWDLVEHIQIYHFLTEFPAHEDLLENFERSSISSADLFVADQPYKSLYTIYALRQYLLSFVQDNDARRDAIARTTQLIVSVICDENVLFACGNTVIKIALAQHLTGFLVELVKDSRSSATPDPVLGLAILERLQQMVHQPIDGDPVHTSHGVVTNAFEAMLEISLCSLVSWNIFKALPQISQLVSDLLLHERRAVVRKAVAKQISQKCTFSSSVFTISAHDVTGFFWPIILTAIPQAALKPETAEETFWVASSVFGIVTGLGPDATTLTAYMGSWGQMLLSHSSQEGLGPSQTVDVVAKGLASLLYRCMSSVEATSSTVLRSDLAVRLFETHLFPDLTDLHAESILSTPKALMSPLTRRLIYDVIWVLIKDDGEQYNAVLSQLEALVHYDCNEDPPYQHDMGFVFDRSKTVRSSTGYVGLRNLSNTCYLNSLFTQLFMNVSFRQFMLGVKVVEGRSTQKLLMETQKLFGFLQDSIRRFYDPTDLAESVQTYDENMIDVSVQMDVDEFYNLIFDRWESQLIAPSEKKLFRSFYGGQLVQQVKSKECAHISERLEPFSAIQCDIKGKTSLQESLQAYVNGEIMDGDNKYKCSTCDRHVSAVKRACFKEIPNSLIFHLKRFDFNLRTMQRGKINDYFTFPTAIDMRPYKVEYLTGLDDRLVEDTFELVGILVHSGTAESGHYYSYVKERPSDLNRWVEFNDDNVMPFDPNCIETSCFGGPDTRPTESGGCPFDKSWSAYMLFYQRSSSLRVQQIEVRTKQRLAPVRLTIPPNLAKHILNENQLLLRKYWLYDEGHIPFVMRMMDKIRKRESQTCSNTHTLEKAVLDVALLHFDQVVVRTKDLPDFPAYILFLKQQLQRCAECSRDILEWFIEHPEAFRQLLFRHPEPQVRGEVVSMISTALKKVKSDAPYAYGVGETFEDFNEDPLSPEDCPNVFVNILNVLQQFWETFHLHTRAWPEYFRLLSTMADFGVHEAAQMLDEGFLKRVLDVVSADLSLHISPQYVRMLNILSKKSALKPASFESVLELLVTLLRRCNLNIDCLENSESRYEMASPGTDLLPVTKGEFHKLTQIWLKGDINILVEKVLQLNQNVAATQEILTLLLKGPSYIHDGIARAVQAGICRNDTTNGVAQYLEGALTICKEIEPLQSTLDIIASVVEISHNQDDEICMSCLRFFRNLHDVSLSRVVRDGGKLRRFTFNQVPFWTPSSLTCDDPRVRSGTEDYLQQAFLDYGAESLYSGPGTPLASRAAELSVVKKLGIACLQHLLEVNVQPRLHIVQATQVSILAIISMCQPFYTNPPKDDLDLKFQDLNLTVLPQLRCLIVDEPVDDASEWDTSDNEFPSEVIESFTEYPDIENSPIRELSM